MSKTLLGSLFLASGLLVSTSALAQTCFEERSSTSGPAAPGAEAQPGSNTGPETGAGPGTPSGPMLPQTCVTATVEQQNNDQVTLSVAAIRFSEDITSFFKWTSNIDGHLGSGKSVTASLSAGVHTIRAYSTIPHREPYFDEVTVTVGAEASNCAEELASTAETYHEWYSFDFTNTLAADVNIYWLRYQDGERILYKTLGENQSASVTGYPGNNWLVTDTNGQCLSVHTTGYGDDSILISR